jgi:raffinose/stachyose/melibiose transport system substrate-binding protein
MRQLTGLASASAFALMAGGALAQTIELRVLDSFTETAAGMDNLIVAFEAANPDIDVIRDVMLTDDMRAVIQTALNSGTGPDVFYYDTGPGFAGVLAEAGLLRPLDDLYASGALDHVYDWTKERTTFGGHVYGVGNQLEFVAVFYNADLFAELGLTVPATYEDFLAVAAAIKEAGVIPVAFGNQAGWPAFHNFSLYANNFVPQERLEAMIAGAEPWTAPEVEAAVQAMFIDMQEAGFLNPSVNAVSYDDANNLFMTGLAAMTMTGSWMIPVFKDTEFQAGMFFLPAPAGKTTLPPAGLGSGYFISSATEHPEAAERFITFLYDPANAAYWIEQMYSIPPYDVDTTNLDVSPLLAQTMDALAVTPMGYNIDVLTSAEFNTAMLDGFQAVLASDRTAAEQVAAMQAAAMQAAAQ